MPFDSVGVADDRCSIWGAAKERQIEGLVDFPMKLPKLPQTCPEFCMRFYLTKRVERRSDIIDGLFLFYLELYILNSVAI